MCASVDSLKEVCVFLGQLFDAICKALLVRQPLVENDITPDTSD